MSVTPIRAGFTPQSKSMDESVVAVLEELLAEARAGEISGIAVVPLYYNDLTRYLTAGRLTRGVIGALELLKVKLCMDDLRER